MRRALQSSTSLCAVLFALLLIPGHARAGVVGHVDYAINSDARIANYRYTADHEQVVILQAWETSELRRLKRANPDVTVLMYQNASSASTSAAFGGLYPTGVSYPKAQANHWLLKNTSGQPFTFEGFDWLYATNIGARGYQRAWADNVIRELKSAPWSGVFIDDLNPTIAYHYPVDQVARYPSNRRYGAAMGRFARYIGRRIRRAGELAIANIGSWSGFARVVDPWLRSLSGAMNEEFVKLGTTAGSGYTNEATWRQQLREVSLTQSEHKLFLGVTHSTADDRRAALYGYATELLAADGNATFSMNETYNGVTRWFAPYGYQIGRPAGDYTVRADGVYERAFRDGRVLVNPTSRPETVALHGTYSGCGLGRVRRVRLRPQSGLVLTRG
jgi:hypothetical protein